MVLDYAISAQKYPKIVTQEKEKFKESPTVVFKTMSFFLRSFDVVFDIFRCINQTFHHDKNLAGIKLEKEMWC